MDLQPSWRILRKLILFLLVLLSGLLVKSSPPAQARTGTYSLAIIRVKYSDTTSTPYTLSQLTAAGTEIHDYFTWLSRGNLDVQVSVVEVALSQTRAFYWNPCATDGTESRVPCPPPLIQDAAQAAAAGGLSFTGINGIIVLNPWCAGDWTNGAIAISRPGVSGTFQRSYDFECGTPAGDTSLNPPGASGVWWNGWAHEIGHQLQLIDGVTLGGNWNGHPSGYASGYDLMDSCYPCDEGVYGLSGPPVMAGDKKVFAGWLPSGKVVTVPAPSSGTGGMTVVLSPLEHLPSDTTAAQGIKIPIAPGKYYLVEVRRRLRADSLNIGPGIWDEGVHIREIEETRDPPVRNVDSCDTTVAGGCVRDGNPSSPTYDPRAANCLSRPGGGLPRTAADVPAYCWPYPLWHVGNTFNDAANAIQVRVDAAVGDGFSVTVTRGVPPGHPDLFVVPWLTPPMNTWETIDIWVDSSCNGYESDVGPSGLRYGRRGDGTVIGNGDDPCANHRNRIYAHVRNAGDLPANDVRVHFRVTNPLGVGISSSTGWTEVGVATAADFPALASLAPGASTDVYVEWTPAVSLTPEQIAAGHFNFHSCVQVVIDPVSGEIVTSNQDGDGEQENFDNFEAVRDRVSGIYTLPERDFFLRNPFSRNQPPFGPRTFFLNIESELPPGWSYSVADGLPSLTLNPDEVRRVPVKIVVPRGSPIGQTYLLKVDARTLVTMTNQAIPPGWSYSRTHEATHVVAGVVLAAQTVLQTNLSLSVSVDAAGKIKATGVLDPAHQTNVVVDYTDPSGNTTTRLASTDSTGKYQDTFSPSVTGVWKVRTIWQGDLDHAGAVSDEVSVSVRRLPPPQVTIPRATIPVKLDGSCDSSSEYRDALALPFDDAFKVTGTVYIKQDSTSLYICMRGAAGSFASRFVSVYVDTQGDREPVAEEDDLAFRVNIMDGKTNSYRGSGVPNGYVSYPLRGWSAKARFGNSDEAEFVIPLALIGGSCRQPVGLAVYHHWVTAVGNDYGWPNSRFFDQPQTWGEALPVCHVFLPVLR
ncbi:MAG: hypothetical protein M5U01_24040 [Ardenticatenaceae bacterium]|nr:hypothetical protein [Ardenticatenaceae bacterium]